MTGRALASTAILALTPCVVVPALAQPDASHGVSATVTLASEYAWRGLSLSDRRPSLLLGIDAWQALPMDLQLEGGLWAYSTRYTDYPQARLDSGAYAKLTGPAGWPGIRWSLQVARYVFPQIREWNYAEAGIGLARPSGDAPGDLGFEIGASRARHAFGTDSRARYLEADVLVRLPAALELRLHGGRSHYDRPAVTYPDFTDWKVAVAGTWQGTGWEAGWIATRGADFGRQGRPRLWAAVSRTF